MLISIETHTAYDFPVFQGGPDPLWIRAWGDCASSEPSLLANATSTRMRLVQ